MADYTVVPANVIASVSVQGGTGTTDTGVTIAAGDVLAQNTNNNMILHDANAAAPANVVRGIALHGSLAGQPISYARADNNFAPGFGGLTAGDAVIASQNPGKMCPDTDKAAGWFVTEIGRAIDATHIKLNIVATGVVR